jgi:hypothetical protein
MYFDGPKDKVASCLLRTVHLRGLVSKTERELPEFFSQILSDQILPPSSPAFLKYLKSLNIKIEDLGGSFETPLSSALNNKSTVSARFMVIHDTSFPVISPPKPKIPEVKEGEGQDKEEAEQLVQEIVDIPFPKNLNDPLWYGNNLKRLYDRGQKSNAHVFIGRPGNSLTAVNFNEPWRATKFELKQDKSNSLRLKGLFLHVELVQPRKRDISVEYKNDFISPEVPFTQEQYQRLALVYIAASVRGQNWIIPALHGALDDLFKYHHDDPQGFELEQFSLAIENHMKSLL